MVPTQPFELPDGSVLEVDGDRLRLPELYFDPTPVAVRVVSEPCRTTPACGCLWDSLAAEPLAEGAHASDLVAPKSSGCVGLLPSCCFGRLVLCNAALCPPPLLPVPSVQELVPGAEPLPASIMRSIMAVDMDIRRDLVGSVLCVGGSSSIQGLTDRVGREIAALAPVRGCSSKCLHALSLHAPCMGMGWGSEGRQLA